MSETISRLLEEIGPVKNTAHNKVSIVGVGQGNYLKIFLIQHFTSECSKIIFDWQKMIEIFISVLKSRILINMFLKQNCYILKKGSYTNVYKVF
jgi:hypothetical protein